MIIEWIFWLEIIVYLFLFGVNSLSRLRKFSPDSMNYVDVAKNFVAGRGLVQSTLGFNVPRFSIDDTSPTPLISQPPVYPLLIGLFSCLGVSCANAALLIPA